MAAMAFDPPINWNDALVGISEELTIQRPLPSLFEHLAGWLGKLLPVELLVFSVNCPDQQSITLYIVENGRLITKTVRDAGYQEWIRGSHIAGEYDLPNSLKWLQDFGIRSYCSVPLSTARSSPGSIGVGNRRADAYTDPDVALLRPVAAQVAFAVNEELTHRRLEVLETNRQEEDDFRWLIEKSPDYAIGMLDSEGQVLTWSTGAQRLAGYSAEEIIGHHISRLNSCGDGRQAADEALRVAAEQGRIEVEQWVVRIDGSRVWANIVITSLRDRSGQVRRFLIVARDVTQRKLADEALLVGMADVLGAGSDVQTLLSLVSASIGHLTPHDDVTIALYNSKIDKLSIIGAANDSKTRLDDWTESLNGTPSGWVFRFRRPLCLNRIDDDRFPEETMARLRREGVKSGYWVPLINDSRVIGVLSIRSVREDAFVDVNTNLVIQVANLVALAMSSNPAAFSTEQNEPEADGVKYEVKYGFGEIVHSSIGVRQILAEVETVAPTDTTVLILGETGTGKELVARAIHAISGRRQRAFVKLNCAAIPSGLLESELFGHEKGAFTGAISQKMGRMEMANHGTLFLDEVGEIPLELQPKLLRALQEREFERLGSTRTIAVNVRLIAATNQNLEEMVKARQFRNDLYYRLKVFPITIPPLRDRPEDIPLLSKYFMRKHAKRMGKGTDIIPPEGMEALKRWHWPGNVRELENFIERAVVLSRGRVLNVPTAEIKVARSTVPGSAPTRTLENAEREAIISALRQTGGVIGGPNGAAAQLGLKRTTLNFKMRKLGITRKSL
jgi:formate hydrogenlyase transcriptional activator